LHATHHQIVGRISELIPLVARVGRRLHASKVWALVIKRGHHTFPNNFFHDCLLFLNSRLGSHIGLRRSQVLPITVVGLNWSRLFWLDDQTPIHRDLPFLLRAAESGLMKPALGRG